MAHILVTYMRYRIIVPNIVELANADEIYRKGYILGLPLSNLVHPLRGEVRCRKCLRLALTIWVP